MIHGGWSQEDGFKPWQKWHDWFSCGHWLSVDLEDVGRGAWAIVIAESGNGSFIKELDPFDRAVQPKADVDLKPHPDNKC